MVESTVRQHIGACFSALEHKVLSQLSEACQQLAVLSNASTQDKPLLQVRVGCVPANAVHVGTWLTLDALEVLKACKLEVFCLVQVTVSISDSGSQVDSHLGDPKQQLQLDLQVNSNHRNHSKQSSFRKRAVICSTASYHLSVSDQETTFNS